MEYEFQKIIYNVLNLELICIIKTNWYVDRHRPLYYSINTQYKVDFNKKDFCSVIFYSHYALNTDVQADFGSNSWIMQFMSIAQKS